LEQQTSLARYAPVITMYMWWRYLITLYFTIKLGHRAIDVARAEGHSDVVDTLQNATISEPVSEKVERTLRMFWL